MIRKAVAILLLFAAPAAAQEGPSRVFEARDLFSLEAATDTQISPDGSKIAYVRRSGDIMTDRMRPSIWLVDTRTGEQPDGGPHRSEEHTSELQSQSNLVCRLLLEKKKKKKKQKL